MYWQVKSPPHPIVSSCIRRQTRNIKHQRAHSELRQQRTETSRLEPCLPENSDRHDSRTERERGRCLYNRSRASGQRHSEAAMPNGGPHRATIHLASGSRRTEKAVRSEVVDKSRRVDDPRIVKKTSSARTHCIHRSIRKGLMIKGSILCERHQTERPRDAEMGTHNDL